MFLEDTRSDELSAYENGIKYIFTQCFSRHVIDDFSADSVLSDIDSVGSQIIKYKVKLLGVVNECNSDDTDSMSNLIELLSAV